jgi:hypothetical protein
MRIELNEESASVAIIWALEWHRFTRTAMTQATEHYFHGCADVAMARSPLLAIEAMHQTRTRLLSHSAHTFAEAIMLWHRQNMDLLVAGRHQRATDRRRSNLRLREQKPNDGEVR